MNQDEGHQQQLEEQELVETLHSQARKLIDELAVAPGGMAILDDLRTQIFAHQHEHDTEHEA